MKIYVGRLNTNNSLYTLNPFLTIFQYPSQRYNIFVIILYETFDLDFKS